MSMQEAQYDYRKFAILYVDDEAQSLKAFSRAFGDDFRIFTAINIETHQYIRTGSNLLGIKLEYQRCDCQITSTERILLHKCILIISNTKFDISGFGA